MGQHLPNTHFGPWGNRRPGSFFHATTVENQDVFLLAGKEVLAYIQTGFE
jgi:hypothetical protein